MASDSLLSTFPLLTLPDDVIRRTIRVMGIDGILCFSLASRRCKQYVISLRINACTFEVLIQGDVNFDIENFKTDCFLNFPSDENVIAGEKRKLEKPHYFTVCEGNHRIELGQYEWTHFGYQDWLEPILDIGHHRSIQQLHFDDGSFLFDLDGVKKAFGKARELYVEHTGCYDFNQMVFQKFAHIELVRFDINVFRDPIASSKVLIQNIHHLHISDRDETSQTLKLNDLLMINSKFVEIENLQFSLKEINKFMKLWMKGSNPRLECLEIEYLTNEILDQNVIMKGIKYAEVSKEQTRVFQSGRREYTFSGGIDIQRTDGTRATIRIDRFGNRHVFEIFVWHDHCFDDQDKLT